MKASVLKERNEHISLVSANVKRKAMYEYLNTLGFSATDIFQGNHFIDDLDKAYLDDLDYDRAFDKARAVLSYRQLNIYGAGCDLNDEDCLHP